MSTLPIILSAELLSETINSESSKLLILDVRSEEAYKSSHIESARWFDKAVVNRSQGDTQGLLPSKQDLARALANTGFTGDEHVVIYNENCNPAAGRVAWTLYAFGIKNISLLNGGLNFWLEQKPVTNTASTFKPSNKQTIEDLLSQPDSTLSCSYKELNEHINSTGKQKPVIIDARSTTEYEGSEARSKHAGHIPGAVHVNWTETKADDGLLFKTDKDLHALFEPHLENFDQTIVSYCQSHQRSALLLMVMLHLGYKNIVGYPGAWSDWGNRDDSVKTSLI